MTRRPGFFYHLHPPAIPAREARLQYTFGLGGLSLYFLVAVLITGVMQLFYYVPSGDQANVSLHTMNQLVPYGQLVRSLHYWAGQALVVTCVFHMLRVVLSGAYKAPRRFNWLLGLTLLVLVLLFDFTGYALRWDSEIAWALLVGTNLLRSIPIAGRQLYGMVVGGGEIGPATIVRLYGWHVYGLALIAFFVTVWHLFRVRRDGGISRAISKALVPPKISRHELVRREALVALAASILLLGVAWMFPPDLGPPANFDSLPVEASAPWFFLWIQQLLRYGPPLLMGVLIPLFLLLVLALLPYGIDRAQAGVGLWFNREGRLAQAMVLVIVAVIVALSVRGALK